MPGTVGSAGQPEGIEPDSLSESELSSLRQFAMKIATRTESHLPNSYWVDTAFQTSHGLLSLGVMVGCPDGNVIQCEIRPTEQTMDTDAPNNPDSDQNGTETEDENTDQVSQISQQLAATAAYQAMQIAQQTDTPSPAA